MKTEKLLTTLFLASLGSALEFYDFTIFAFFAPVIGKLFFPDVLGNAVRQLETLGIFAAGYFARPLGGIVMAHFGDIRGRKRIFSLSVLLMAIPTLLIGLLPTYQSIGFVAPLLLLAMRVLQGIAIGGEAPGAWVFVAEHAPRGRTGFAIGALSSGRSCGMLLGSMIAAVTNSRFSQAEIAAGLWRVPFLLGGVFGLISVLLRGCLTETPVFQEVRKHRAMADELPLRTVLRTHKSVIALGMLSTWMLTAAIVVVILISPSLLQNLFQISPSTANFAACAALCVSAFVVGAATDRFGIRRISIGISALLIFGVYALYVGVERRPSSLIPLYIIAGFGAGGAVLTPLALVTTLQPAFRFTGVSVSYNFAYSLFGGITPLLVAWLVPLSPLAAAHYVAIATIAGLTSVLILPELRTGDARTSDRAGDFVFSRIDDNRDDNIEHPGGRKGQLSQPESALADLSKTETR